MDASGRALAPIRESVRKRDCGEQESVYRNARLGFGRHGQGQHSFKTVRSHECVATRHCLGRVGCAREGGDAVPATAAGRVACQHKEAHSRSTSRVSGLIHRAQETRRCTRRLARAARRRNELGEQFVCVPVDDDQRGLAMRDRSARRSGERVAERTVPIAAGVERRGQRERALGAEACAACRGGAAQRNGSC